MPPASTTEGIYYLRINGKVEGPFTIGQIYDLWAARKINSQTAFARFEEMDKWQPLSELTLKISAPKQPKPSLSTSEAPVQPAPVRPRQAATAPAPTPRPEEYAPTVLFQSDEKLTTASRRPKRDPLVALRAQLMNFSVAIGLCTALGLGLVIYFALLYPPPARREAMHDLIVLKQTGVLAGIGLLFTSAVLVLAHQIDRLRKTLEAKSSKKSESPNS